MKTKTILPMAKNKEMNAYFKKCLENFNLMRDAIKALIDEVDDIDSLDATEKYNYYKLVNELDTLEGKISVNEYMMELYEARIAEYMPIFEKESEETNLGWEDAWNKAKALAEKEPLGFFGITVHNYPEKADQELKNSVYKAIRKQLEFLEKANNPFA